MSRVDVVGLARQTAGMGTKVTVPTDFPPVMLSEPTPSQDELTIDETIGNRFPTPLDYGTRFFNVNMGLSPRPASFPRILSAFLGQPTTVAGSGGAAGSHVHTFDPAAAGKEPEPHSIYVVRNDPATPIVDLFWDAIGDQLEITMEANDYAKAQANFIALDLDDTQSAPSATIDSSKRWKFSQIVAYVNLNGAGEVAVPCKGAGVTYTNSLDTDNAILGTRKLYGLPFGNANCELKLSPRENIDDFYREALKADPTQSKVRLVATGGVIGASSESYKLEVILYEVEFVSAPAPANAAEVLKMVEVTARTRYSTSLTKFVDVKVTNATAAY